MINKLTAFKDAAEFIKKDIDIYEFDISKEMNSLEYNLYLQDTQYYLEVLYEKVRVIEEMIDYLDSYSDAKISKIRGLLKRKENILNTAIDQYLDTNFITISPEWISNPVRNVIDRDGTELPPANIVRTNGKMTNQNITPGSIILGRAKIISAIKTSNQISLSDNISDFIKTGTYVSAYELNKPAKIRETLTISFEDFGEEYDSINYSAINCDVTYSSFEKNKIELELRSNYGCKIMTPFYFDEYAGHRTNDILKLIDEVTGKDVVTAGNKIVEADNKKSADKYIKNVELLQNQVPDTEKTKEFVQETKNCWKYVPGATTIKEMDSVDAELESKERLQAFVRETTSAPDGYDYKAAYYIGLEDFSICKKSYYKDSGIISKPVHLDNYSYITISSNGKNNDNDIATEFYIIDGVSTVPILPENEIVVHREKLFPNMPTRFSVDRHKEITLYEDNVISEKSYINLTVEDFDKHEYSLTYTPGREAYRYTPNNNDIQILAVFRNYTNKNTSASETILIRKYGGAMEWS